MTDSAIPRKRPNNVGWLGKEDYPFSGPNGEPFLSAEHNFRGKNPRHERIKARELRILPWKGLISKVKNRTLKQRRLRPVSEKGRKNSEKLPNILNQMRA